MRRKCLNPSCSEYVTPSPANRAFSGCCSALCRDTLARGFTPGLALAVAPTSTPLPGRKLVNRKHGIDYRGRDD